MALHAGFAVALSVTRDAVQAVVHAAYVNNLLPAIIKGSQPHNADTISSDLVLAEPQLQLDDNAGNNVTTNLELLGTLTFSGPGKPTLSCGVHIRAAVTMPVALMEDSDHHLTKIGLDTDKVSVDSASGKRISGADPKPLYGVDVEDPNTIAPAVWLSVKQQKERIRFTLPQLAVFAPLHLVISTLGVNVTKDSLNLGIDLAGLTSGTEANLVDLNSIATDRGLKNTLLQAAYAGSDEYGEPIYETGWTGTMGRGSGPHDTGAAVCINVVFINHFYLHLGRSLVFSAFEKSKYDDTIEQLDRLRTTAKHDAQSSYEPSQLALTSIDAMDISLHDDYIQVSGIASNYSSVAVHVDYQFKLSIIRTLLDGDTRFVVDYQSKDGFTAEVFDVQIDQPSWVGLIEGLIATAGVLLAPFTDGVSLLFATVMDFVISSIVGGLLSGAQMQLATGVIDALSGFDGILNFALPGTKAPLLVLTPEDVVLRSSALSAWFQFENKLAAACIHLAGQPSADTAPVVTTVWPASDLAPIIVVLDDGGELFNPADLRVHIRWQVFGDDTANAILDSDVEIASAPDTRTISIDHASGALAGYDTFLVRCRVYRPWNDWNQELFNQELDIKIADRLHRAHPYVHWGHTVFYQGYSAKQSDPDRHALGWVVAQRKSKIHVTDPAKRCRFADRYSPDLTADDLVYLDALPFPLADIAQHRKLVCPYCFFGGPDKVVLK